MTSLERVGLTVITGELAFGVLAAVLFVAMYWAAPWERSPAGRHLMYVSIAWAGEKVALLAMLLGTRVPLWVFVAGYAVADAVVLHRLWLLYLARRRPDADVSTKEQSAKPQEGT